MPKHANTANDVESTEDNQETTDQEETPEAPTPAEPKPVEVSPADQSDLKTDKVLGKDYTVTPDSGYRRS